MVNITDDVDGHRLDHAELSISKSVLESCCFAIREKVIFSILSYPLIFKSNGIGKKFGVLWLCAFGS